MRAEAQVAPGEADARPAQRQARPGQLIRHHWLAIVLLAAGLALRVLTALAYRPALFFTDTVRYLYNAEGMDPVGYKGPLRVILLAGNFNAVAAVQHLLGLAMAVVIYLLLLRRGAPRWLAALAMVPVLLDAYQLQSEQTILPGTWFQALIVAGLAILLWRPEPPAWRRAAAAGAVLGTSALFAQIGEALLVPALIFVLVAANRWRRAVTGAAALAAAFALPILAYCTGSYLMTGDFFLSHTGATSFYGRTAAAAGCATLRLPAAERGLCPSPAQQARGPDWLEYGAGSPVRPYYADLPRGQTDSLITDFSRRVVAQQPQRVLGAYGRDLLKLYEPVRTGSQGDTPISRWQFQLAYPYYQHATPAVVDTAITRYGGGAPAVWRPVAGFLRGYQLGGGYTPGPLLALFTLAGLAGSAVLLARRRDERTRQLAEACLLLFLSAASVLLVSDLFEFSWRYQLPALVTLVPAGALGLSVLLRLVYRAGGRGDPAR
ncbi:MAG: hypothetical protein J2P33_13350 [Actinobacteria bacterium]|nr:hypothetical protein [Actinomycetota bacterium]